jgi:hypothetical protein
MRAARAVDDLALARALHVLAVVIWIGGVAMVTTVILPSVDAEILVRIGFRRSWPLNGVSRCMPELPSSLSGLPACT